MTDIVHHPGPDPRVQKSHSTPTNTQSASAFASTASSTHLNPRSCITCRRRKVKCDKRHPCSNCARAKIECIFPGPGRAPRKSRKPQVEGELMERLRRLEGVVQNLNAQVEEHEIEALERERRGSAERNGGGDAEDGCPNSRTEQERAERTSVAADESVEGLETRFGRLVVDQGRSRYINNSFWASLNNEVEDLKSILIEDEDDNDTRDSPVSNPAPQNNFIFGYSSASVDMLSLHPTPEHALDYWALYKQNVDPLVKVLHIPTFDPVLLDASSHPDTISKSLEPLMFAIYYGAVTSSTPEDCLSKWGESRDVLLQKYRFALEQGLARANFLFCDEMIILQAFVIFMVLLRRNDDARKIWTLTGLAVRIAQTLGIHRDGSHFLLKPFEIEMRRRLWWQVCILDARASEDHGCDPTIVEAQFDTKMPLNVNDTDLSTNMTSLPPERQGFTDMTFCIIRYEVTNIFRRILFVPPGPNRCNQFFTNLTIPEKERWISNCHQRLEEKYLKNCDMTDPLCWITATLSRLIMSKMWLIVYHPYQRKDGGASLPQETKDKLFITSLENIEYSMLIETEAKTMQWGWLFRTYVQWHAIAFLLSELCVRTKGEAVERAWRALDATSVRWWYPLGESSPCARGQSGCLWRPLRKLMAKARAAREREIALERASQVLRQEGVFHPDVSTLLEKLPVQSRGTSAPQQQPSPETLDKMLRPVGPKLGETGFETPLVPSPAYFSGNVHATRGSVDIDDGSDASASASASNSGKSRNVSTPSTSTTATTNTNNDPFTTSALHMDANRTSIDLDNTTHLTQLDAFNSLSESGLDYLIGDVMDGYTLNPTEKPLNPSSTFSPSSQPPSQSHNFTATPLNLNNQTPNQSFMQPHTQSSLSNPMNMVTTTTDAFNPDLSTAMDPNAYLNNHNHNGNDGALDYSPILDNTVGPGGEMDWAVWDDMVSQFGMMDGVVPTTGGAGGPGHLGKVGWF